MGYLDNTSITVDAILTKRGRELLARNDGSFQITQFALGDDEIDYSLFNESHPNGTQFSAEAIENMPIIEAIPNGANSMNSKLITLNRGSSTIPHITLGGYDQATGIVLLNNGAPLSSALTPSTHNLGVPPLGAEDYIFTILNRNLVAQVNGIVASGGSSNLASEADLAEFSTIATSESVRGKSLTLTPINGDGGILSPSVTEKRTTIIIEGLNSGAIISIPFILKRVSS